MRRKVNLSVSLPTEAAREARRYAVTHGTSVSLLVRESLQLFFRREEEARIERDIAEYYANPRARREEADLTDEWAAVSEIGDESRERRRASKR